MPGNEHQQVYQHAVMNKQANEMRDIHTAGTPTKQDGKKVHVVIPLVNHLFIPCLNKKCEER